MLCNDCHGIPLDSITTKRETQEHSNNLIWEFIGKHHKHSDQSSNLLSIQTVSSFFMLTNQVAATKCVQACRRGQEVELFFRPSVRMEKKCDLSDFDCRVTVGARKGGLSISTTADHLGFSPTTVSRVCREWCEKQKNTSSEQQFCQRKRVVNDRGQRRRARLVRKETVTQITTHYNSGMQKSKPLSGWATAAEY